MTYNQFILKSMLFNYRKYLVYFFSVAFSMTVFFLFTAIWFVPDFTEQTSNGTRQIVQIGGVISVLFSLFLITYSYRHFFKSRTKEMGILLSYGMLYRDLKRMITMENTVIFLLAVLTSFVSGGIFSRLFFMMTTGILGIDDLDFSLTYKSFLYTPMMFLPLYLLNLFITIFKMKTVSVTALLKENRVSEMKKVGKPFAAIVGLLLMAGSLLFLYDYNSDFTNVSSMRKVIVLSVLVCVVGMYLFLSHFISLMYRYWSRRESAYRRNILPLSEFASRFTQNRAMMFMVGLLSMGIIFFSTLTYSLYQQSFEIADKEQWFDVIMKDYNSVGLGERLDFEKIIKDSGADVTNHQTMHVVYVEAPELKHTSWRTNKTVMAASAREYNAIYSSNYMPGEGHAKVIDFNQTGEGDIEYFKDTINLHNGDKDYSYKSLGIDQKKLFDRYVFAQPVLILLNDKDYQQLVDEANRASVGSIEMFQFKDWLDSGKFVEELKGEMEDAMLTLDDEHKASVQQISKTYVAPFIVHSKYDRYVHAKQVSGFALFIMSFISILFFLTVCVVLYFKIFTDQEEDKRKIKLLCTIGITTREVRKYLSSKIKMVLVLPVALGSILGLGLSISINMQNVTEMEMANAVIFANGLKVYGLFLIFLVVYYQWLKFKYQKSVL